MANLFVEWSDNFSVGIQEIDEQHKVLINLINRLYDETIVKEATIDVTKDILKRLVQYTIIHFSVEESLFRIFDYPEIEVHMRRHVYLRAQVLELQRKIKQGDTVVNRDVLMFLKKWLTDHILHEDKLYAPFLIKQGVKSSWGKKSWLGRIWN
jgi:hemerythrin